MSCFTKLWFKKTNPSSCKKHNFKQTWLIKTFLKEVRSPWTAMQHISIFHLITDLCHISHFYERHTKGWFIVIYNNIKPAPKVWEEYVFYLVFYQCGFKWMTVMWWRWVLVLQLFLTFSSPKYLTSLFTIWIKVNCKVAFGILSTTVHCVSVNEKYIPRNFTTDVKQVICLYKLQIQYIIVEIYIPPDCCW